MSRIRDIFKINEVTTALINGEFVLDCPEMTLENIQSEDSPVYKGSGYIEQSSHGTFKFKLFSQEDFDQNSVFSEMLTGKFRAGEVIPDSGYYVLKATDLKGREWTSKRMFLPNRNFSKTGKGITVFSEISTIYHEESLNDYIKNPVIKIQILDDIAFPANSSTEYSLSHRDHAVFKSMNMDAVELELGDKRFFLIKHDNTININVVCQKGNFPNYFDIRIIEAFQFITSRSIKKTISETRENKKAKLRIQLIKNSPPNTRSHPPIIYTSVDETGCIWKLFDKYLEYISTYSQNDWHPLSSRIWNFIEGGSYSFFTLGLILCTEIEGVLKEEYTEIGNPSDKFLLLVKKAKEYFKKWESPTDKNMDNVLVSNIKERIDGLLGMLNQSRPTDKLKYLLDSGVVSGESVKAWKELRPMLAHAYDPDSKPPQEFLDKFFKTLVLFYQLIFTKIGYKGKYTNYNIRGWPFKNFPLK